MSKSSKDSLNPGYSIVKHSALFSILDNFKNSAKTEREKGTYFEDLIRIYFLNEPYYKDYYSDVWTYSDWAKLEGKDARDVGIDLVAKTRTSNETHAIQCKFYDAEYKIQKSDIDSFFTASGQKPFTHRFIVSTTNHWSEHAENALLNQTPPVTKIDLYQLENSIIDWSKYQSKAKVIFREKKDLRAHQVEAVQAIEKGMESTDRGKLIMACGTGKTFTSLKIAEKVAGKGKRVLFLVPSLSLLSQSLTEWTQESEIDLHCFAVCSDSEVGKKKDKNEDSVETVEHELRYPATTDSGKLAQEMKKIHDSDHMSVVFSTYHSIEVIHQSQSKHKLEEFDLIICDEAHRTTGATFASEDESHFVKVHDDIESILSRNYFLNIFGIPERVDHHKTTIPYLEFQAENEIDFLNYVNQRLLNRAELPVMSSALVRKIAESIFEIFSNAKIHSESNQVFCCGQFFPKKNTIEFSITDIGIGIKNRIQSYGNLEIPADKAIQWAMVSGNSTKSAVPGGLGLALLLEFTKMNKGAIKIASDEGFYSYEDNREILKKLDCAFPGTCINMSIRTDDISQYSLIDETEISDIF